MGEGDGSSSTSHVTSTLNCWWVVGPPPHCTCHFNSQLLIADGWWVLLHIIHVTSTLNFQWWWGGSSSSLHMSLQLSTANGQWGVLYIAHVTSTLNCWWPTGVGPPPHHRSLQLSTADGKWGVLFHITCHYSQLLMANRDWVVPSTFHIQSIHIIGGGVSSTSHQVECASAVKPNWLPLLYASTA